MAYAQCPACKTRILVIEPTSDINCAVCKTRFSIAHRTTIKKKSGWDSIERDDNLGEASYVEHKTSSAPPLPVITPTRTRIQNAGFNNPTINRTLHTRTNRLRPAKAAVPWLPILVIPAFFVTMFSLWIATAVYRHPESRPKAVNTPPLAAMFNAPQTIEGEQQNDSGYVIIDFSISNSGYYSLSWKTIPQKSFVLVEISRDGTYLGQFLTADNKGNAFTRYYEAGEFTLVFLSTTTGRCLYKFLLEEASFKHSRDKGNDAIKIPTFPF